MKKNELPPKRALFVKEYLVDLNGTQAAIRAGYAPKAANEQASRLLTIASVSEAVRKGMEKRNKRVEITMDEVLREYKRLATFDIRKVYDENGTLKPIQELDDDTAAALSGIESDDIFEGQGEERTHIGYSRKVKTYDKRAALCDLMRHMGGFEKDNAQQAGNGVVIVTADIESLPTEQKMKALQSLL